MNDEMKTSERPIKLTPRQLDILRAAADDLTCKMTAEKLGTTEKTIQVHRHNLFKRLKCTTMSGAVAASMRLGFIE